MYIGGSSIFYYILQIIKYVDELIFESPHSLHNIFQTHDREPDILSLVAYAQSL